MPEASISSIRLFIVAAPLTHWCLRQLVQSGGANCDVVGTSATIAESIPVLDANPADVILLAAACDTEELRALCANGLRKVLVMTDLQDDATLDRAVMAGVRGWLASSDSPDALFRAIDKVNAGELWINRGATSRIFMAMVRHKNASNGPEPARLAALPIRERQMVVAVASDPAAPGKVIADRLCITEHTLRNHLSSIYSKLGVRNRLDLYAYASRHGLLESAVPALPAPRNAAPVGRQPAPLARSIGAA